MIMKKNTLNYQIIEEKYGEEEYQVGDLYIPNIISKGTVCLLHGGFWRMPYDKHQLDGIAKKLVENNFSVWNIEYRRVGDIQSGYPKTFIDVINAINILSQLSKTYTNLNLQPLYIAGHSAGGHLCLWLSSNKNNITDNKLAVIPDVFIGLAPVVDLLKSYESVERQKYIYEFIGCTPDDNIEIYHKSSPIELLPSKFKQIIFHGDKDEIFPIIEVEQYEQLAHKKESPIEFVKIKNGMHMDFCDANSIATSSLINWLNIHSAHVTQERGDRPL